MKGFTFNHILQTAFFRIIPSYHGQIFTNAVVNGRTREFSISNKPTISNAPVSATVVEDVTSKIIKSRFDVEHYFQVRLSAKLIVELSFNHDQFLFVIGHHIHFVRYASAEYSLASLTLESFGF